MFLKVLFEFYFTVVCLIKTVFSSIAKAFKTFECMNDTFEMGSILSRGGVSKILRNTNGGSCQMLTIDDKGGGRGVKNPKNLLT